MKSLISIASLKSRSFNVLKLNFERNKRNCNCNVILSMLSPHSYLGTLSHKVNDARHNRPSNSICVWNETMCNARTSPKQMLEELCKRIEHCCATLRRSRPVSNCAQQLPTTRNNMQQGVQTYATCNSQQCCVRLHGALEERRTSRHFFLTPASQAYNW